MKKKGLIYFGLHLMVLWFAISSLFSKKAAGAEFLSKEYIFDYLVVLFVLAVYAIFWQMILKVIPLSIAMANKAATVIWGILFGAIFFHEKITWYNIVGAIIIIVGIVILSTGEDSMEHESSAVCETDPEREDCVEQVNSAEQEDQS